MNKIIWLCIIVFFARIIDTSLATIRSVLVIKEKRKLAVIIAFFEILVWFLIVKEALNTDNSAFYIALSYSAGYATGVYVGMIITDKFIPSNVSINIVVHEKDEIIKALIDNNFAVSISKIKGKDLINNKYMIFVATTSKKVAELKSIVTNIDPKAFIVISENKAVIGGYK